MIQNSLRPELKRPQSQQLLHQAVDRSLQARGLQPDALSESEKVSMSEELLEEPNALQATGHGGLEALLAGLAAGNNQRFDQKLDDKVQEVGAAQGAQKATGRKDQAYELEAKWTPATQPGKIHRGSEKIGEVKQKLKPRRETGEQGKTVQSSLGQQGAPRTGAPRPVGRSGGSSSSSRQGGVGPRRQPQDIPRRKDRVQLSEESKQKLAPLQQKSGDPGLAQRLEQKAGSQSTGKSQSGEVDLGTEEIRANTQQWSQTAWSRSAGDLKNGDLLRMYQNLDGISPEALEMMKARQDGEQPGEHAERMGLAQDQVHRLKNPQPIQS